MPEAQAAQFGGDPDNFNFPRYSLDASFLRAYEDGKPVATPQHLEWSARAPVDGEATFVVGNPGSTQRLLTSDQLAFQRELVLPITVTTSSERRGRLIALMESDPAKLQSAAGACGRPNPRTIDGDEFASAALESMRSNRITSLFVLGADGRLEGAIHMHDLLERGLGGGS